MEPYSEMLPQDPARHKPLTPIALLFGASIVPLVLLLWVQWPLREWMQAGHRHANDLAQLLFAFYTVLAVAWASYHQTHLQIDPSFDKKAPHPILHRSLGFLLTLPWLLTLSWFAWPLWWQSFKQGERFIESMLPGFHLLKLALLLLPFLLAWAFYKGLQRPHPHD